MSRTVFTTIAQVDSWISRQSQSVSWAISPEAGQPRKDAWHEFSSGADLPRAKKLLIRPGGAASKGGVHVFLAPPPALPSSLESVSAAAQSWREEMSVQREALYREREEFQTYREERTAALDQRTVVLDERAKSMGGRLGDWEDRLDRQGSRFVEMQAAVDQAMRVAHQAESRNEMAASMVYMADKIAALVVMYKVKKIEDVPPDMIERFARFCKWESDCRLLDHLPSAERAHCRDFMRFSKDGRQAILQAITDAMRAEVEGSE